jgi:autotransporter-associated beta strand protein
LQAGRSLLLNASITTDNGDLTLIANDLLASGVINAQRDPGNAVIAMAPGTSINAGAGTVTVDLRSGAGKTYRASGAVTLGTITAGALVVTNDGPSAGSDVNVGPAATAGPQSYGSPHGLTHVTGDLAASDRPITFTGSVLADPGVSVDAGAAAVTFGGSGTQTLSGTGATFAGLLHSGRGALRLLGDLTVAGAFTNAAGLFDANGRAASVGGPATVADGTSYLGGGGAQAFNGGLSLLAGGSLSGTNLILGGDLTASADDAGNPATLSGALSLGGAGRTFSVAAGAGPVDLLVSAVISGDAGGGLAKDGPGTLRLTGDNAYTGPTTVRAGALLVDGAQPSSDVFLAGGLLGGVGQVGAVTAAGGNLIPGDAAGNPGLLASGPVALASAATFSVQLNGTTAGSGYSRLNVAGTADLDSDGGAGSTLAVSVGFDAALGDTFTILHTTGGVAGTFQGLPEGSTVVAGGVAFRISYLANGGNDVVLTRV